MTVMMANRNIESQQETTDSRISSDNDQLKSSVDVWGSPEPMKPNRTGEVTETPNISGKEIIECTQISKANEPKSTLISNLKEVKAEAGLDLYHSRYKQNFLKALKSGLIF